MDPPSRSWPGVSGVWSTSTAASIASQPWSATPVIVPVAGPLSHGDLWFWDLWPIQDRGGNVAVVVGGELWMALAAPVTADPVDRHAAARLWLLHRIGDIWHDLGPVLPGGQSPGSREWSGSAFLDGDRLVLHFTAAGRSGEATPTFEQRLFSAEARLEATDSPVPTGWTFPMKSVASDGVVYDLARETAGTVGTIKAFRDPTWFCDPADGAEYLLFTASLAASRSAFNGAVGIARFEDGVWRLLPPLITADGVNNELERPHVVVFDAKYYLFWSTQASVFAPGIVAPTGLYGMVAPHLHGPWVPINGTGLVIGNPPAAPDQAYSWLVLGDLRVTSFIDRCPSFVGRPAPELRLQLTGDRAALAPVATAGDPRQSFAKADTGFEHGPG